MLLVSFRHREQQQQQKEQMQREQMQANVSWRGGLSSSKDELQTLKKLGLLLFSLSSHSLCSCTQPYHTVERKSSAKKCVE